MKEIRSIGIILQVVPFRDRERIISVFTKDLGLISIIVKYLSTKKSQLFALTSSFCLAEFVLKKTRSDIFTFVEGNVIEEHLFLRKDLNRLKAASFFAKYIMHSQMQKKESKPLFLLLKSYLQNLQKAPSIEALLVSFQLKLLIFEGVLKLHPKCNRCKETKTTHISSGESLCAPHAASQSSFSFTKEQMQILLLLGYSRSFDEIGLVSLSKEVVEKVNHLFEELTQ